MQVYVRQTSKINILGSDGIRRPELEEVEFADKKKMKANVTIFGNEITGTGVISCKCKGDEFILERTKENIIKINKGYSASEELYGFIMQLAIQGNYKLEIGKLENTRDLYKLDKIVEHLKKST